MVHPAHAPDPAVLEPFRYITCTPGKDVRGKLIDCFTQWLPNLTAAQIDTIKAIVGELHNASLLVDDIEDGSQLRRGQPVAHKIFGVPLTLNCANYVYFTALARCHALNSRAAMDVFVLELLNLHRGQGQDILWRDTVRCPTLEEYETMVLDKTGGLFRLAVGLMQAVAEDTNAASGLKSAACSSASAATAAASAATSSSATSAACASEASCSAAAAPSPGGRFTPLVNKLALYFQIRDDLVNLRSDKYMQSKSYCEDLTEGKFSYPIIHAIRADPSDTRLLAILKQRTESVEVKRHAVEYMASKQAFTATAEALSKLHTDCVREIEALGGHPALAHLLAELDRQMLDVSHDPASAPVGSGAGTEAATQPPPPIGRLDTP